MKMHPHQPVPSLGQLDVVEPVTFAQQVGSPKASVTGEPEQAEATLVEAGQAEASAAGQAEVKPVGPEQSGAD